MTLLLKHPGVRLLMGELRLWRDLVLLCTGRVVVPVGAVPLPAVQGLWFLPGALTAVTVVEITAVELLVPSVVLRVVITVISVYSLLLLWAVFGRRKVYPHAVDTDHLVLRQGRAELARIPRDAVADVLVDRGFRSDRAAVGDGTLVVGNGAGTSLRIQLHNRITVPDPDRWPWQKPVTAEITEVLLWVDDPVSAINVLDMQDT